MLRQLFDTVNGEYQRSKKLQLIQTIWDVMLYSKYFTFHWKLLVLVSRIQKSGTGENNFGKWKGTFLFDRPKWPDRSLWTTFKAGPQYSGRTKPKWSVPFDEPAGISGILGWMENAPKFKDRANWSRDTFQPMRRRACVYQQTNQNIAPVIKNFQNSRRGRRESIIVSRLSGIFLRLFMRHKQFFLSGQRIGTHVGSVSWNIQHMLWLISSFEQRV